MNIQEKLMKFVYETAFPFIIRQPNIENFSDDISFLLVGSTATGLCSEYSDVDICLLCPQDVFDKISMNTNWVNGRPTEIIIEGIQLHYYAISVDTIINKIKSMDDITFYIYRTAIALNDNSGMFIRIQELIENNDLNKNRKIAAFDILTRRNRALKQVLSQEKDPIIRLRMSLEIIEHLLKAIALTDNLQFDIRKRLYITALLGQHGQNLKCNINNLFSLMGQISNADDKLTTSEFIIIIDDCFAQLI